MKILVTGGAGYIGSVTSQRLIEEGHDVVVIDDLSNSDKLQVPEKAKFYQTDIIDCQEVLESEKNIEAVIHFASYIAAGESVKNPGKYWENNVVKSLKFIELIRRAGIKNFIFSSSAAVYGNPRRVPIVESDTTVPTNTYGATKLTIDLALSSYCLAYDFSATSLRYFNVAGAYKTLGEKHKEETHLIPLALQAVRSNKPFNVFGNDYATQDGTCIRDYIHVEDLADAHILALEKSVKKNHKIYNLGNEKGFSNFEVLKAVEKITGNKIQLNISARREGDPEILVASNEKAKQELGWEPKKTSLEVIIKDAWAFYSSR